MPKYEVTLEDHRVIKVTVAEENPLAAEAVAEAAIEGYNFGVLTYEEIDWRVEVLEVKPLESENV